MRRRRRRAAAVGLPVLVVLAMCLAGHIENGDAHQCTYVSVDVGVVDTTTGDSTCATDNTTTHTCVTVTVLTNVGVYACTPH